MKAVLRVPDDEHLLQYRFMTTRNQHFVWRYYLEAWQSDDGLVLSSRKGEILPPTNPRNLMAQRDYYKLSRITRSDVVILSLFIESAGTESLVRTHRNLLDMLTRIANANEIIQCSDRTSTADKDFARALVIEVEEKLHGQIERDALPFLNDLRQNKTHFIDCYDNAIKFYHFIAQQYFRTKRMRETIGTELAQMFPNSDLSHLKHIVCHIGAVNVGGSLFVDRNDFDITLLEATSDAHFITSDQPIVNLLGTGDGKETTGLALYYPISPNLACVIAPKEFRICGADIPAAIVEDLNRMMASEAGDFLVAKTEEVIRDTLGKSSLGRPNGQRILEAISNHQR